MTDANYTLIFTRRFEAAHRFLMADAPRCRSIHGHTWSITARIHHRLEVQPPLYPSSMVAEFSKTKKAWHRWVDQHLDHTLMLNESDPLIWWFQSNAPYQRLVTCPGDPTTELLAALLLCKVNAFLRASDEDGLMCHELQIQETPTNAVSIICPWVPAGLDKTDAVWWNRADDSTHDLAKSDD